MTSSPNRGLMLNELLYREPGTTYRGLFDPPRAQIIQGPMTRQQRRAKERRAKKGTKA
jgi:hypothetical protein